MIEISDVVFDYPGTRALHGVSCTIPRGSATALVGPNGAGKTTLMRCIAGLDLPLSGKVSIDGMNVSEHPRDIHMRLGFLYDFYGLYDDLTVTQSLNFRVATQGIPKSQHKDLVAQAIDRLGLAGRAKQRAGTLSRGWRQKLSIALSIVHDPEVILLDEPASGLDPDARADLSALIRQLHGAGKTLLVSSHILAELSDYSTHVLVIRDGHALPLRPLSDTDISTDGGDHSPAKRAFTTAEVSLAAPFAGDWTALIDTLADVSLITADDSRLGLRLPARPADRATVLKALIEAGVAVADFTVSRPDLRHTYAEMSRPNNGNSPTPAKEGGDKV